MVYALLYCVYLPVAWLNASYDVVMFLDTIPVVLVDQWPEKPFSSPEHYSGEWVISLLLELILFSMLTLKDSEVQGRAAVVVFVSLFAISSVAPGVLARTQLYKAYGVFPKKWIVFYFVRNGKLYLFL